MQSLWSDSEASDFLDRYAKAHGEAFALRVYSSRLIGRDTALVLHGGGNTSVKTTVRNVLGDKQEVVCIKASGFDLATIEPGGFAAVEIAHLLRLRQLDDLSDAEMTNQFRTHLVDARSATPSVETLLHAYLPHRFVDHTHADAILELTNQPNGVQLVREALGEDVEVLPYIHPGFPLARAVADACDGRPECRAVVLVQHGIFTFDDDARTSYERMIALVDAAERFGDGKIGDAPTMCSVPRGLDRLEGEQVARAAMPIVRGALCEPLGEARFRRMVGDWRGGEDLLAFTKHEGCRELVGRGPLTPDHVIRTKGNYLVLTREQAESSELCRQAVAGYVDAYRAYYERHAPSESDPLGMVDPYPRVVLIDGAGALAFGENKRAARIAGDITEHTLRSMARSEALGDYRPIGEAELFAMEYWSLEQAKLSRAEPPVLAGHIVLITGAAGAIGYGIAAELLRAGAHTFLTDLDHKRLGKVTDRLATEFGSRAVGSAPMDVCDAGSVAEAFGACCLEFGGVDCVVPNAGIAYVSELKDMDSERFRKVLDVNLTGTMYVMREAALVFEAQGIGGSIVVQASKNVFAPGGSFGAYSASKAGAHQLGKIAAMELAPLGVRVNMINADAVFGDDEVPSGLWAEVGPERMQSRGLDPEGLREYYRERSMLKVRVLPEHVGKAVVFFASFATPTTGATLPVDGGVAAAFPR